MAERFVALYHTGDRVEVHLSDPKDEARYWQPGVVVAGQHPGVWVLTADRKVWFVTNGQRIRVAGVGKEQTDSA